jgi:hypothetical protein
VVAPVNFFVDGLGLRWPLVRCGVGIEEQSVNTGAIHLRAPQENCPRLVFYGALNVSVSLAWS